MSHAEVAFGHGGFDGEEFSMKTKSEIRAEMRRLRKAVLPEDRKTASSRLLQNLMRRQGISDAVLNGKTFALYLATPEELDVGGVAELLWRQKSAVAVPRWNPEEKCYSLARLAEGDAVVEGPHGVREPKDFRPVAPEDVDVWIVPGLAFSRDGRRLGYGGGWYDRLLAKAGPKALAVGVAYRFQIFNELEELPQETHDRRVDCVVATDWKAEI